MVEAITPDRFHAVLQREPAIMAVVYLHMMITIDGSMGEGGGQIVRSALALSLVTRAELTIERIRAARSKPGLQRQHLTAVRAAAEVGQAEVTGDEIGSARLVFRPQAIAAGDYHFSTGTAGSTSLVLQTVLPALMIADGPSSVVLEGGTHNPLAPPFEFLAKTYLPLLRRIGPQIDLKLERHGFYPAGGGKLAAQIKPAPTWRGLSLLDRGDQVERRVRILLANLPQHIARREADTAVRKLGWPNRTAQVELVTATGPGNVVLVEIGYEHVTEVVAAFGQKGVKAERVAGQACNAAKKFIDGAAPVGEHLADQLLLLLALAAHRSGPSSSFRTASLSSHATTDIEVITRFLPVTFDVVDEDDSVCIVTVQPETPGQATAKD